MHDLATIQRMNAAMRAASNPQPVKRGYRMEVRVQTESKYIYLVFPWSPRRVYRQLRKALPHLRKHKLLWLTETITMAVKAGKPHDYRSSSLTVRIRRHDYNL